MPGYKIAVGYDTPQLFMNKNMNALEKQGHVWEKEEKAKNVIKAQKNSKNFTDEQKKSMHVVSVDELLAEQRKNDPDDDEAGADEEPVETEPDDSDDSLPDLTADPEKKERLFSAVVTLADMLSDYMRIRSSLSRAVGREDAITLDLMHYIELTDKDDRRQDEYASMLRECRIRRRRAKDMLIVLDALEDAVPSIVSAAEWIKKADARIYRPRAIGPLPEEDAKASEDGGNEYLQIKQIIADCSDTKSNSDNDSSLIAILDKMSIETDKDIYGFANNETEFEFSGSEQDGVELSEGTENNIASSPASLEDCLVRFSVEFAEDHRNTHKPNSKGKWSALGNPDKVLEFAKLAEEYITAISDGEKSEDAIVRLGKTPKKEKEYRQIVRGTGFAGKIAKSWKIYRNHVQT